MMIRFLGPLEVEIDGEPVDPGSARERSLLALLALSPGEVWSTDRIAEALWGEQQPGNSANAVQAAVSRLRKAIGSAAVETRPGGYALAIAREDVDAGRFESLVRHAASSPEPEAALREARRLWRGPPLPEFADEEFAVAAIAHLNELKAAADEAWADVLLDAGRAEEATREMEQLVALHPMRESATRRLMLARYRCGRAADALAAYRDLRERLAEELGVDPAPALQELELAILQQDPALLPPASAPAGNLPLRATSFVGREREVRDLIELVRGVRVVSLVGPGGAGKTSLAVEVGRRLAETAPHGVWFVDLSSVGPGGVAEAFAATFGFDRDGGFASSQPSDGPLDLTVDHLSDRGAVLVVDNCEHVLAEVAPVVARVAVGCPGVTVVATSRERLGVAGEHVWRVPPLGAGEDGSPPAELQHSAGVQLFIQRAQAVNHELEFSPEVVEQVAAICRRLDGLPLAIELAAARCTSLSPAELQRRLDEVLPLLTKGDRTAAERHQTLRAAIEWSDALLEDDERAAFRRLSVFQGSFDLDMADALLGGPSFDVVDRLVERSMVVAVPGAGRFRILETLRAFGREALRDDGDLAEVRRRHTQVLVGLAREFGSLLRGPEQFTALERLDAVLDDVRAALDWSEDAQPTEALRLAGALAWYWYLRGHRLEGRARIVRLLDLAEGPIPDRVRADALLAVGMNDPSPTAAAGPLRAASAAFTDAGEPWWAAVAASVAITFGTALDGDPAAARAEMEEPLATFEAHGDPWGVALWSFLRANIEIAANDYAAAGEWGAKATDSFERAGDAWGIGYMQYLRGVADRTRGSYEAASASFSEALAGAQQLGLRYEVPIILGEIANVATLVGDFEAAGTHLARAEATADEVPFRGSHGMVRNARGLWLRRQGRAAEAHSLHREAAEIYRSVPNPGGIAYSEGSAAFAAAMVSRFGDAAEHTLASLEAAQTINDLFGVAFVAEASAALAAATGQARAAAVLLGAASALRERLGAPLPDAEAWDVHRTRAAASEDLGAETFAAAFEDGRRFDLAGIEDAIRGVASMAGRA